MKLPNFLLAGAPKCGTTSLYHLLKNHPEVYMPPRKEPYYFIRPRNIIGKGPGPLGERLIDNLNDYRRLFEEIKPDQFKAVGEATAGYLYFFHNTIPDIKETLGDPKIIIILRDPAERAFSSHLHHVRRGYEPLSFEVALQKQNERKEKNWWFGYQLIDVGLYFYQVKAYLESFSKVNICLFDDLKNDPIGLIKKVYDFLEVDSHYDLQDSNTHYNSSLLPKSKLLHKVLTNTNIVARSIKPVARFFSIQDNLKIIKDNLIKKNLVKPKMKAKTREHFIHIYRDDIRKLQNLINRDLSDWLK